MQFFFSTFYFQYFSIATSLSKKNSISDKCFFDKILPDFRKLIFRDFFGKLFQVDVRFFPFWKIFFEEIKKNVHSLFFFGTRTGPFVYKALSWFLIGISRRFRGEQNPETLKTVRWVKFFCIKKKNSFYHWRKLHVDSTKIFRENREKPIQGNGRLKKTALHLSVGNSKFLWVKI